MPINVTCKCGRVMKVPDTYAGKKGRCPRCNSVLEIPAGEIEIDDSELILDSSEPPSEARVQEAAQSVTATGRVCPRCKARVPGAEEFCPKCGANYVMASRQMERKEEEGTGKAGKGKSGSSLVKIGIAGGIVVALAVAAIFIFARGDGKTDLPKLGKETSTGGETTPEKTATTTASSTQTAGKSATTAARQSAASRQKQEIEELLSGFADADETGRAEILSHLSKKGKRVARLVEKGLKHENPKVRTGTLEALILILGDRALSYVSGLLKDEDVSVRRFTFEMAKQFSRHEQIILPMLEDEDAQLAGEVALYLVLKDYHAATSRIRLVLDKKGAKEVSERMAVAALSCGFSNGTYGSIGALASDDPALREAAIKALEKAYGTKKGYDASASEQARKTAAAAWKDWWKKRTTFEARMTALVNLLQQEEKLRRSRGQTSEEYGAVFWQLLIERWRIVQMGADAVPGLAAAMDRKVFRGTDRLRAEEALRLLALIGEPAVIPISLVAKNPNHPNRAKAVLALAGQGDSGAKALLGLLEEKPAGVQTSDVLNALGRTGSESGVKALSTALESSAANERFAAFSSLAHLGKKDRALAYLPEIPDLRRPMMRELLVRISSPKLADALIERAASVSRPADAAPVLTLLGEIAEPSVEAHLKQLLKKDGGGFPLSAVIEAAARHGNAKLALNVLNAADKLRPEEREAAYLSILYFEDESAFNRIFQDALKGGRFSSQLLPELARRGIPKAKTTARTVATKATGMAQVAGLRALGFTGDRLTTKRLWKSYITLKDPMSGVRDAMIELVGRVQFTDAIPYLIKNLEESRDIRHSVEALGRMSDAAAEKALIDRLPNARRSTLEALALNPSSRLVSVFGEVLQDAASPVDERIIAARALGRTGSSEAMSELRNALTDPRYELRAAAAASLGVLGDKTAVPYLVTLALDGNIEVRREAMLASALLDNYYFISDLLEELEFANPASARDREFLDRALGALAGAQKKANVKFQPSDYTTIRARLTALGKLRKYYEGRLDSLPKSAAISEEPPVAEGFTLRKGLGEIPKEFGKIVKKYAPKNVPQRWPGDPLKGEWESKKIGLPHKVFGTPAIGGGYIAAYIEIPPSKPETPPPGKKKEPKPTYKLFVYDIKGDAVREICTLIEAPKSSLCINEGGLYYFHKTAADKFDRAAKMTVCEGELKRFDLAKNEDKKVWETVLFEEPVYGPVVSKDDCVIQTKNAIRVLNLRKQEETALADRMDESTFKLGRFVFDGASVWWKRNYLSGKVQSMHMDLRKREKSEHDAKFLPDFTGSRAVNVLKKRIEIWDYSRGQIDAIYAAAGSRVVDGRFLYFTAGRKLYVLDTEKAASARIMDNIDAVVGVAPQGILAVRGGDLLLLTNK
ncbi:MAG: HEAT repeat domain-containing protein [Planctomycetota bacterium]|jgi:HEAT repeat protein